jgi:hypothetical protein
VSPPQAARYYGIYSNKSRGQTPPTPGRIIRRPESSSNPKSEIPTPQSELLLVPPPFDIDTMEPIQPPWQAIKEWIADDEPNLDWFYRPRNSANPDPDEFDQRSAWRTSEVQLDEDRVLVLEYS